MNPPDCKLCHIKLHVILTHNKVPFKNPLDSHPQKQMMESMSRDKGKGHRKKRSMEDTVKIMIASVNEKNSVHQV
jgi:hypothetical protein